MSFLTENPFAIGIGGTLLVALSLILLLQTTKPTFLYAAIGMAVVTALLLLNERRVVTPQEEVHQTISRIAQALESNDIERVLSFVSPTAATIRQKGESALKRVVINQFKVKPNLTIEVTEVESDGGSTQVATATFNAVIIGSDRKNTMETQRGAWFFVVDFAREPNGWKIIDYQRHDPRKGI